MDFPLSAAYFMFALQQGLQFYALSWPSDPLLPFIELQNQSWPSRKIGNTFGSMSQLKA
jgi:hypothetical protein